MAFTDRFLKVPVILYNVQEAEMVGYNSNTAVDISWMKIDPYDISWYRPSQSDDKSDEWDNTLVWFKCGDSRHINLAADDFDTALNEWFSKMATVK